MELHETGNKHKRISNDETIEALAQNIYENTLNDNDFIHNPNDTYSFLLEKFCTMYGKYFPLKKIKLKANGLKSP